MRRNNNIIRNSVNISYSCPSLPFSKRERNLKLDILEITRSKCGRAFHTVKVVVKTRALGHEHRARNSLQVNIRFKVILEESLDKCQRLFKK